MKGKIFNLFTILLIVVLMIFTWIYLKGTWFDYLFTNFVLVGLVTYYMFPSVEKSWNKDLNREKSEKARNLLLWTDSLKGGDNYLAYLLEKEVSKSIPENMEKINKKISSITNNEITKLRLIRAFFKAYKERQTTKLYFKTVGTGLLSFVIFLGQAFLQGRIQNKSLLGFFNSNYALGVIISAILTALYYFLLPHRGENRLNLVVNILDEIIEEEVNKEKNKKVV